MKSTRWISSVAAIALTAAATGQSAYIANVPDIVQPPTLPAWLANGANWCTPTAASNVVAYWNANGYAGASGGFANQSLAGEMGWFMDTNDQTAGKGVAADNHLGTWETDPRISGFDAVSGLRSWASWDAAHTLFGVNNVAYPGATPGAKVAYGWQITLIKASGYDDAQTEVDAGRPLISNFAHWDLLNTGLFINIGALLNIPVYDFNPNPAGSAGGISAYGPWEQDFGLGHSVTTVGYYSNFAYQGGVANLLVVHDTFGQGVQGGTPVDLAIIYNANLWKSNIDLNPVPEPASLAAIGLASAWLMARRRRTQN